MIRARIHRAYVDMSIIRDPEPHLIPVGWDYEVYDTTTRCTLIARQTLTHSHALSEACRHLHDLAFYDELGRLYSDTKPLTH